MKKDYKQIKARPKERWVILGIAWNCMINVMEKAFWLVLQKEIALRPGVYRTAALGTAFHGLPLAAERAAGEGDLFLPSWSEKWNHGFNLMK